MTLPRLPKAKRLHSQRLERSGEGQCSQGSHFITVGHPKLLDEVFHFIEKICTSMLPSMSSARGHRRGGSGIARPSLHVMAALTILHQSLNAWCGTLNMGSGGSLSPAPSTRILHVRRPAMIGAMARGRSKITSLRCAWRRRPSTVHPLANLCRVWTAILVSNLWNCLAGSG
jgi:hypothetical protein